MQCYVFMSHLNTHQSCFSRPSKLIPFELDCTPVLLRLLALPKPLSTVFLSSSSRNNLRTHHAHDDALAFPRKNNELGEWGS